MENRIKELFRRKSKGIISVYLTAGYPNPDDTAELCGALAKEGVDLIEIGIPFSDPVADGPVIQASSQKALQNGMTLEVLFEQAAAVRKQTDIPLILMGYLNPVYQYGIERFAEMCSKTGIDGTIIPDLPASEYLRLYQPVFRENNLINIFLVTPQTSEERIKWIDEQSEGFIYAVSSAAVTGGTVEFDRQRREYLSRLAGLGLKNPLLVGFGISKASDLREIQKYAAGGIIGSAFIRALDSAAGKESLPYSETVRRFVEGLRQ